MALIPLSLPQVAPLLPPDSRGQLALLDELGLGLMCVVSDENGEPSFALEVFVAGQTVRTGGHRRIGPALVDDLASVMEGVLGRDALSFS